MLTQNYHMERRAATIQIISLKFLYYRLDTFYCMSKDFDSWNITKKAIDAGDSIPFYHEREIWWCSFGKNIGFEQDGTGKNFDRPVLVLRGFNRIFFGLALTGKKRTGKFYYYLGTIENRDSSALLSQARIFDAKRLIRKMTTLDKKRFESVRLACKDILFP